MKELAQGFVEVSSYISAVEAADAMSKGADVTVTRVHKVDGPILTIICEGDVAACKAAVDVASALASARGTLLGTNIIPRPEGGGQALYDSLDSINAKKAAKKAAKLAARQAAAAKTPVVSQKPAGAGQKTPPVKSGGRKAK